MILGLVISGATGIWWLGLCTWFTGVLVEWTAAIIIYYVEYKEIDVNNIDAMLNRNGPYTDTMTYAGFMVIIFFLWEWLLGLVILAGIAIGLYWLFYYMARGLISLIADVINFVINEVLPRINTIRQYRDDPSSRDVAKE